MGVWNVPTPVRGAVPFAGAGAGRVAAAATRAVMTVRLGTVVRTRRSVGCRGGQSNIATVQITVGKDTVKPVVNKLELTTGKKSPGKPRPLFFELAYSERSTATVSVRRQQANGKFKEIGSLRANELRRRASLRITGELLVQIRAGGSFRAFAVATDAAGNGSTPKRLDFTR